MASTSASEVKIGDVNEETNIWSIGKCVICNMQLTGDSKMLNCLHLICKDCISEESSGPVVECKCLTVTKGKLIDYPIESSNLSTNKDHNPDAIMAYPMLEEFPECPSCKDTYADVYCIACSVLLCQFCHLHSHHNHNYKVIEKFLKEINSNILLEKFKLESNNENLDFSLEETKNQIQNLEIKKRAVHEEIDRETEMLHKEINKCAFELKYLVDNCFSDTIGETHKNKQTLKDLQNKNKYYIEITKSVLSHKNLSDFLNVSRVVLTMLEKVNNNTINISEVTSKLESDLKNNFDETMSNCISSIKEIGNIIATPVFGLSKTNGINTSDNACQTFVNLETQSIHPKLKFPLQTGDEEVNTSNHFMMDTDNVNIEPCNYVECSCCRQLAEKLVECFYCARRYHNHCHTPSIPENVINEICIPYTLYWQCTMCDIMRTFSKTVEQLKSSNYSVSIGEPGRTIIERILMELFCQNDDSVHFRECPNKRVFPTFYEKISNPISLNIIKNHLESNIYYASIVHVIDDLKQVFLNALMFYHPSDGYYDSARELLTSLNTMVDNWIPELTKKEKAY